jgi:hypothetical protein
MVTIDKIKVWAFPGMMSILAAIIWQDVQEIKSDTKTLLAQSMIDKTRIDNLEREVFGKSVTSTEPPYKVPEEIPCPLFAEFIMVRPEDLTTTSKESIDKPKLL